MKKHYGRICEYCGAHLDPGERCDCKKAKAAARVIKKPIKPTAIKKEAV